MNLQKVVVLCHAPRFLGSKKFRELGVEQRGRSRRKMTVPTWVILQNLVVLVQTVWT